MTKLRELNIRTVQPSRYTSWRKYPVLPPFTFRGIIPPFVGVPNTYFTDSNDFYSTFNAASLGIAMTEVPGNATIASLHKFLQTMWIYVKAFNLTSTNTATLNNNLQLIPVDPDGMNKPIVISSAANISNQQFNPSLINNCYAFILTFADALRIAVGQTGQGELVRLTLIPGAVGFYGSDLDDFINTNPKFASGIPINCN